MARDADTGTIVLFGGGRTRDEATAETWLVNPAADTWEASR